MTTQTTYDIVPYPRLVFAYTHPGYLAALATLLGMQPKLAGCRVLEIGCASGSNLIPMAVQLPDCEFVGIDTSQGQIAVGQADIAALNLHNIQLVHADLAEIDASYGQFDYIITHGVFSWVPPHLREKILSICHANLAPDGVAYISYNVYPGWLNRIGLRQMLLYHTRNIPDPAAKASEGLDFMRFMATALPEKDSIHGALFHAHFNLLRQGISDEHTELEPYLLHEYLETDNTPLYFYQFAAMIEPHGLQYLCDVDFWSDSPARFAPHVVEKLGQVVQSQVELQQYMDFLRDRGFRRTLLCHSDIPVNRNLVGERIYSLYMASGAIPEHEDYSVAERSPIRYAARDGKAFLTVDHPLTKAAMYCLRECWPLPLSFAEVTRQAEALLLAATGAADPYGGGNPEEHRRFMASNLIRAFVHSPLLLDISALPPGFVLAAGERPVGSPWARRQAESTNRVTTLRYDTAMLSPAAHSLLCDLDGTNDRAALRLALQRAVTCGEITLTDSELAIAGTQGGQVPDALVEQLLSDLAHFGLITQ